MNTLIGTTKTRQTSYNGWTNYETWVTNLYITNDIALNNYLKSLISNKKSVAGKASDMAWMMSEMFEESTFSDKLVLDLLRAAFDRIRWVEIIQHNS